MRDFAITQESLSQEVKLLQVAGYLDAHTFEELEDALGQLHAEGIYKIIVDLSQVDYISSAGAGVFIGKLSESQENGGNIVLLNPTNNVRDVFDLLGLTQIFNVADSREAALAAF